MDVEEKHMKTQMIDIKTPDGVCDAFMAYPEDNGAYPAILMYMDGFGLRPYLYEMATTIAARGFYVLLPNMFYRLGRAPIIDIKYPVQIQDMPEIETKLRPLFKGYDPEFGMHDAAVFFDFLAQQKQVRQGPIGITGYCMGGGLSIRTAARFAHRVAIAASFHAGNLATDAPNSPHAQAGQIKARLYIAHADMDKNMPPEQIERLKKALDEAHIRYEAELYNGAAHGFTMADLPAYNETALKRHWHKLFELLESSWK